MGSWYAYLVDSRHGILSRGPEEIKVEIEL